MEASTPSLFPDRDVWIKEQAPAGGWSLYIFGPSRRQDPRLPAQPPLYASFRKIRKDTYTAVPFGHATEPDRISIRWNEPEDVCSVYIDGDCFVLFRFGRWRGKRREAFRVSPEPPFSAEEMEIFDREGALP